VGGIECRESQAILRDPWWEATFEALAFLRTLPVTKLKLVRINKQRVAEKVKLGFVYSVLLFVLLFTNGCYLSAEKQGLGSGKELPGERHQELSEPLGMSSRLYLDSQ